MGNDTNQTSKPRTLQTAERTLKVIETLKESNGMTVTEMANELDCSMGGAYNHLATLREKDFVVQVDNVYKLSPRFVLMGEHVRQDNLMYQFGKDELEEIVEETGEYGQLITEEHGLGIVIYLHRGEKAVGSDYRSHMEKKPLYLHHLAAGKAILAELPEDRVEAILDKHELIQRTSDTITDRESLYSELESVREQGYAYNDEEEVDGLRAIGAPIVGPDDDVLGALSISGPKSRMQGDRFETKLPKMVKNTADVIEINIQMEHSTKDL
ncbi:IclR family transcriptional regulator [Halorientalis pallida]|uniref:IclR family transcriptional regulator n=1 Tax=Halorientalis pallida TaxID=2479928 RepID=A0A498L0A4_9EURY|nr:IclR family transcriptional regulator [Halorientalis pallida]RXK47933.1 IclR family transcriptional regulator [Halorientalis pallida]